MGFYDAFKDVLKTAQKADNLDLYKQLLDLSAQALDLQAENAQLKEEVSQLKKQRFNEDSIVRHFQPYLTLKDDLLNLKYCATCWDSEHKLVQMREFDDNDGDGRSVYCNLCNCSCRLDPGISKIRG